MRQSDGKIIKFPTAEERQENEVYAYEHKGYILQQSSYNWHFMIIDKAREKMVFHSNYNEKLTEAEAIEAIEFCIALRGEV